MVLWEMFPRSFGCLFESLAAEMWGCFNTSHLVKLSVDLEVFFEKPEVGFGSGDDIREVTNIGMYLLYRAFWPPSEPKNLPTFSCFQAEVLAFSSTERQEPTILKYRWKKYSIQRLRPGDVKKENLSVKIAWGTLKYDAGAYTIRNTSLSAHMYDNFILRASYVFTHNKP